MAAFVRFFCTKGDSGSLSVVAVRYVFTILGHIYTGFFFMLDAFSTIGKASVNAPAAPTAPNA